MAQVIITTSGQVATDEMVDRWVIDSSDVLFVYRRDGRTINGGIIFWYNGELVRPNGDLVLNINGSFTFDSSIFPELTSYERSPNYYLLINIPYISDINTTGQNEIFFTREGVSAYISLGNVDDALAFSLKLIAENNKYIQRIPIVSSTEPTAVIPGQMWFNPSNNQLFVYTE